MLPTRQARLGAALAFAQTGEAAGVPGYEHRAHGQAGQYSTVALFGPGSAVLCGAGEFWKQSPYRAIAVDNFPCRDQGSLFKREIRG